MAGNIADIVVSKGPIPGETVDDSLVGLWRIQPLPRCLPDIGITRSSSSDEAGRWWTDAVGRNWWRKQHRKY